MPLPAPSMANESNGKATQKPRYVNPQSISMYSFDRVSLISKPERPAIFLVVSK